MLPGLACCVTAGSTEPEVLATEYFEGTTGATFTVSHTVAAGSDCLVVTVASEDSGATGFSISGVTYNGASFSPAVQGTQSASGGRARAEIWYLFNPPTGVAYDIVVTRSGSVSAFKGYALAAIDARNCGSVDGTPGSDITLSANAWSVSVTSTAPALFIGVAVSAFLSGTATWSSGVVELADEPFNPTGPINSHHAYYESPVAGAFAFTCQLTGSTARGCLAVAAFKK